ncbi:MAG: cache domain-containing protein [Negativicutes bacterium]|nr:cache domain-containing protein [Negativicutes bacterium]
MKNRLIAILLLVGLIPVLVVSAVFYATAEKNARTDFDRLNKNKVQAIQADVEGLYDMHMAVLKLLARSAAVRGYDLENVKPILADMVKAYPMFIPVAVDRDGRQVAKTATYSMSGIADRQFYIEAMKGNEEVLSEVVVSRSTGLSTVILATPIYGTDGAVTGVMQGSINLMKLTEFVTQRSEGTITAFIVDKEGKIMAHPDKTVVADRKDVANTAYFQKGMKGSAGVEEITDDKGNQSLVYYSQEKKTGWLICIETSSQGLKAQKDEMLRLAALAIVITLLAAVAAGYYLARTVIYPGNSDYPTRRGSPPPPKGF